MEEGIKKDEKRWLKERAEIFLQEVGIKKDQKVLDFGCHEGNYTIPAARIVGGKGKIYAIDKEKEFLAKTMKKVKSKGFKNVIGIIPSNELEIPLGKETVDVILLYDILHRGYLPESEGRKKILNALYKILKESGLLSVYLTHLKQYGMTFKKAIKEIENAGFIYGKESYKKLVHDNNLVRGRIFTFRKTK